MSTEYKESTSSELVVAAIDFGTTYSGYAFSFKSDWSTVFANTWKGDNLTSVKAPTALLLNPDKTFNSFGYEAEKRYTNIATGGDCEGRSCKEYYYFFRFKNTLQTSFTKRLHRETTCKDKNGREVKAMLIFTFSIRYLKDHLLENIKERLNEKMDFFVDNIKFVLTVPAIWNGTAKMFMREAAIQAGIPDNHLELVLEPEAASIYCLLMHLDDKDMHRTNIFTRKHWNKYMVLDLGGGTTDITVYKLQEDKMLTELVATSSEEWGGANVDKAFTQFLEDIFGSDVLETCNTDPEYIMDYLEFFHYFESKKMDSLRFRYDEKINISIPLMFCEIFKEQRNIKGACDTIIKALLKESKYRDKDVTVTTGKLGMSTEFFESFFNPTIDKLIARLSRMFKDKLYSDIETIFVVGGFSKCCFLQEQLKNYFGNTKHLHVVFSRDAGLSVLKGAVYSGHCKMLSSQPVALFTFGFQIWPKFEKSKYSRDRKKIVNGKARCRDVFLKMFTKGEPISFGLKKSLFFKPMVQGENVLECGIYVSNQKDPKYVDEPGCAKLGTVLVPLPIVESKKIVEIEESITYGETQIKVSASNCKTKEEHEIIIDLLSPDINLPDN